MPCLQLHAFGQVQFPAILIDYSGVLRDINALLLPVLQNIDVIMAVFHQKKRILLYHGVKGDGLKPARREQKRGGGGYQQQDNHGEEYK